MHGEMEYKIIETGYRTIETNSYEINKNLELNYFLKFHTNKEENNIEIMWIWGVVIDNEIFTKITISDIYETEKTIHEKSIKMLIQESFKTLNNFYNERLKLSTFEKPVLTGDIMYAALLRLKSEFQDAK